MLAWWGTHVECASAIARLERESHLTGSAAAKAFSRLQALRRSWHEIQPAEELRESAIRFLRVHDLRAGDALQLAAVFLAAERRPSTLEFVCLDERLSLAAQREGFVLTQLSAISAP
jgi:predicted nucleic acid-binding protein